MYLRSIEIVGFKSFAGKTRLDFEPGMTAIVGPNGCGKSNISDAIRWVLGEQSAKALRGGSMQDCIFNGTDDRKPLGMAEVSLILAECEGTLDTEYNEVTITRRVFRSGDGQYFINKTPCRLRDIQRLFMDTGIGTNSYSLMEQGRIDQILSAHPDDRRAVFEEASGITKFKADKKEAIRKLEHTEANLLRLADVIREVKRRIGSLQRQAGKARRYTTLKDELRALDVFITQGRITEAEANQAAMESRAEDLRRNLDKTQQQLSAAQSKENDLRHEITERDARIGSVLEAGVESRSKLEHTRDLIEMNRQRIAEYHEISARDAKANEVAKAQLAQQQQRMKTLAADRAEAQQSEESARTELAAAQSGADDHREQVDNARSRIQQLREQALQRERQIAKIQNDLAEMEARERSALLQHERLAAERSQLKRLVDAAGARETDMARSLAELQATVRTAADDLNELESRRSDVGSRLEQNRQEQSALESRLAAARAQTEMLEDDEEALQEFPPGARLLLNGDAPGDIEADKILGALANQIEVADEYRPALEGALRSWRDTIVVRDVGTGRRILAALEAGRKGSVRLVSSDVTGADTTPAAPAEGVRLVDRVSASETLRPLLESLLGHVVVVDSLEDVPPGPWQGKAYATRSGIVLHANGCMELCMADAKTSNPLSRKHRLSDAQRALSSLQSDVQRSTEASARLHAQLAPLEHKIEEARRTLEAARHRAAQKEGETQVVIREAATARERLETVTWELGTLDKEEQAGQTEKSTVRERLEALQAEREAHTGDIATQTDELHQLEARHTELQSVLTEQRVDYARVSQRIEHLGGQWETAHDRLAEITSAVEDRSQGIRSYTSNIASLEAVIKDAENRITELEDAVSGNSVQAATLKQERAQSATRLEQTEAELDRLRASMDELRDAKSGIDVRCAELRMKRENQVERITSEYGLSPEELFTAPSPDWGDEGVPELEILETRLAELKTKLEAMGPVNLIAIEEYEELQQRFDFLTEQESDLTKAKQQLMDMIRKINRTTSEMFTTTFHRVNDNFQAMFRTLFGGGTAKLVLVDDEDVLECGIEIIARPPGKRLQNVSLLSGGERTLTAVSLLFAIYMIKPSPFCLLDELDAALDDSNIGRFVKVLEGFLAQSQFVIITHNQQTIAAAQALYGVTMEERGVSKIVSVRFTPHGAEPATAAAPAPARQET